MSALLCPLATPTVLLGFSYLGRGVSLQGCSSKVQLLLLTLDEEYLSSRLPLMTLKVEYLLLALLHLCSHHSLDVGLLLSVAASDLGYGVAHLRKLVNLCGMNESWNA